MSVPPVKVQHWAAVWWLVGDGPAYLLFRSQEGRVLHLTGGLPRALREALKGYQAIHNMSLVPLAQALVSINTAQLDRALYRNKWTPDAFRCLGAAFFVLKEIEHLIFELPEESLFESRLARLVSLIRAAKRFVAFQSECYGTQFPITFDEERAVFWLCDSYGHETLFSDYADRPGQKRVFRCDPHSVIARACQELWAQEQAGFGDRATSLYRVRTRKELRQYLCLDEPAIAKLAAKKALTGCHGLRALSFPERLGPARLLCRVH